MRTNSSSSSTSSSSSSPTSPSKRKKYKNDNNNYNSYNNCGAFESCSTNDCGQQQQTNGGVDSIDASQGENNGGGGGDSLGDDYNCNKSSKEQISEINNKISRSLASTLSLNDDSTNNMVVNLRTLKREMNSKLKYRTSLNSRNNLRKTTNENNNKNSDEISKKSIELEQITVKKQSSSSSIPNTIKKSDVMSSSIPLGLSSISSSTTTTTTSNSSTSSNSSSGSSTSTSSLNSSTTSDCKDDLSQSESESESENEKGLNDDDSDAEIAACSKYTTNKKNLIYSNDHNKNAEKKENRQKKLNKIIEKFNKNYDNQLDKISDKATALIADGSFYNCGLYQFISFLFVSIAWTIGNGWYAYVSVFTGYSPPHECDYKSMPNATVNENDKECSALNIHTNETMKCTKWIYDQSQMKSTIITEFNFVCDKNYHFELAYSLEQIGYIVGTLIFSFIADLVGRKPVMVSVLIAMSIMGLIQQYVYNFIAYMIIGFIINSLACGLEAVCVTLVLEMFSTSKRTLFGIGIEVVWVVVLAAMSPLAYFIKTWREIRLAIFLVLSLLAVCSFWLVQESIRWLISMSRLNKAKQIIQYVSSYNSLNRLTSNNRKQIARFERKEKKINKLLDQLDIYNKLNETTNNDKNVLKVTIDSSENCNNTEENSTTTLNKRKNDTIFSMFKNAKFRVYVLIMALNWFATALVYDGLTYLNNFIGENIYINWILMNLIELPAQIVCYLIISRYGRRLTISLTLVAAGVILLASLLEMIEFIDSLEGFKLAIFVLAKFIITQSYSGVIIHAPELFPTNLRSFGYGICLFSGKITSAISPIISIYISKVMPRLPPIIYGVISIICGIISLYVPETLNRPLPNSVDDVIKWPRTLSKEENKMVKELNKKEFNFMKEKLKNLIHKLFKCKSTNIDLDLLSPSKSKSKQKLTMKSNLKASAILLVNESEPLNNSNNNSANNKEGSNKNYSDDIDQINKINEKLVINEQTNSTSLSSSFSTNSVNLIQNNTNTNKANNEEITMNQSSSSDDKSDAKLIKSSSLATTTSSLSQTQPSSDLNI